MERAAAEENSAVAPEAAAPPAQPLILQRRRGVRLMMRIMSYGLFLMAPALLCLPLLTGQIGNWTSFVIAIMAAGALAGSGVVVLRSSDPNWLTLSLDETGLALRQGRRMQRREWTDVSAVQVTRRKNGRTSVPTLLVACTTGDIYLDDVYTMSPSELAKWMQQRCAASGNPWPAQGKQKIRALRRFRLAYLILPGFLIVLALLAGLRLLQHPF